MRRVLCNGVSAHPSAICICLPAGRMFESVFEAIAEVCHEQGLECRRASSEFSKQAQLEKMQADVASAEIVVADITAKNPNVLYQVGYAHALGKRVILLTQHAEDFPFSSSAHPVIVYAGNVMVLKSELSQRLWTPMEKPQEHPADQGIDARARFDSIFGPLLREHGYEHRGSISMENESTFVLQNQEMELPLVQDLARRAKSLGIRLKLL
jgi:hypothetical protein